MLVVQSCIVADPPEYRTPGQTRPLLDVYSASPTATRVLVVLNSTDAAGPRNVPINFNVRIQSEDAGEPLRALYFLDYGTANQSRLNGQTIPASTYDYKGRVATYSWIPDSKMKGCHFVTLVVAHFNSFLSSNDDHLDPTKAEDDASLLSWTVNINPSADAPNTLAECPSVVSPQVGQ